MPTLSPLRSLTRFLRRTPVRRDPQKPAVRHYLFCHCPSKTNTEAEKQSGPDPAKRAAYLSALAELITACVKLGWLALAVAVVVAHLSGCPAVPSVQLDLPGLADGVQLAPE